MRVSIAIHAPAGERFGPNAFAASIGLETVFLGHKARVVAADVHETGTAAVVTFDVEASEDLLIPTKTGFTYRLGRP